MRDMLADLFHWLGEYRKPLFRIFIIFAIIFVVYNGMFFVSLNHPKSCTVCHYMDPYYDQWKESSHNAVKCLKCHKFNPLFITISTVKYVTGTYNPKPHAVVDDSACTAKGCHSLRLESPDALFEKDVIFNHRDHMEKLKRGEKLRCTSCHYQIVQGEHMTVDRRVCFLCHFKGTAKGQAVGGCRSCHRDPGRVKTRTGFTFNHEPYLRQGLNCKNCHVNVSEGTGKVTSDKCFSCHVERTKARGDRIALHKIHVTDKGISCLSCHEEIKHRIVEMAKMFRGNCTSCHGTLHIYKEEFYMGTGAKGIPERPSLMFTAQVACDGCHKGINVPGNVGKIHDVDRIRDACVECHSKEYGQMMDAWIRWGKRFVKETSKVSAKAATLRSLAKKKGVKDALSLIDDIKFNARFLKSGTPPHNIFYAWEIARTSYTQLRMVTQYLGVKSPETPDFLKDTSATCTNLCHGSLGIPEEVTVSSIGTRFPHGTHAEEMELSCTDCHNPAEHRVKKANTKTCVKCHHGEEAPLSCDTCHENVISLYKGKVSVAGVEPAPDPMSEAEVGCEGCHGSGEKMSAKPALVREKCVSCHEDEEYGKTLDDWLKEKKSILTKLEAALEESELRVKALPPLGAEKKKLLEDIKAGNQALMLLKIGNPAHNIELSREIAEAIEENLRPGVAKK